MARIQTTGIISDISGKVNGSVFQRNQGGLIMRNQSGKINSNTTRSNSQRVGMAAVQGNWQGLTDSQRLVWATYARYLTKKQKHSTTLTINGHQLFININTRRYALRTTSALFTTYLLTTPIFAPPPLPINIVSIDKVFGTLTVVVDRAMDNTKEVLEVYLSKPLSGSQTSGNQKLTLMKGSIINPLSYDCSTSYTDIYGSLINIGQWTQTKISIYNTDQQNFSTRAVKRIQIT